MVVFGLENENDSLDRTVLKKKFVRKFTNQNDKNIQYTFHPIRFVPRLTENGQNIGPKL